MSSKARRNPGDNSEEARQSKAVHADKAAARQIVHDSDSELGSDQEDKGPSFTSCIVASKPAANKVQALVQHTNKVPEASTKVFRESTNRTESSSGGSGTTAALNEPEERGRRSSRSASPEPLSNHSGRTAGDKCHRSSSADSVIAPTQVQKTSSSGRLKISDFDDITQETAKEAIGAYHCFLAAHEPFPDVVLNKDFVTEAWQYGQKNAGTKVAITPTLAKIVGKRGSQFRGELKTKTHPLVQCELKFQSGSNPKIMKLNRTKAEDLKEGKVFVYKNPAQRKGLFQVFLIQMIANLMFFVNRHDEGIKYTAYFNPFPVTAITLILTIDEWMTGVTGDNKQHTGPCVRVDIEFSEADYRSVYDGHLRDLIVYGKHTKKSDLLEKLCIKIHNRGRFHAGVQPISRLTSLSIGFDAFAAAIKEYEEADQTDTDGESSYLSELEAEAAAATPQAAASG
ncbi:hypothetical protein B0H17DRAFT_1208833 [Mycena rosella]|uniref:DUF6532 domain-containing protein n=1 Tax=Mycena rosella TaxID=1033263 RepID=A0AAD7CZQ4_MYCRO|nr:hypothetical protein B0H17DRAFT_1208833 [Mycena rosella]